MYTNLLYSALIHAIFLNRDRNQDQNNYRSCNCEPDRNRNLTLTLTLMEENWDIILSVVQKIFKVPIRVWFL